MTTFEKQLKEFVKLSLKLVIKSRLTYRCYYNNMYASLFNGRDKQISSIYDNGNNSENETELQKLRDLVKEL